MNRHTPNDLLIFWSDFPPAIHQCPQVVVVPGFPLHLASLPFREAVRSSKENPTHSQRRFWFSQVYCAYLSQPRWIGLSEERDCWHRMLLCKWSIYWWRLQSTVYNLKYLRLSTNNENEKQHGIPVDRGASRPLKMIPVKFGPDCRMLVFHGI